MRRAYVVIPEGTPILVVEASSPHFAASKARSGKGEQVTATAAMVTAGSATTLSVPTPAEIVAGQLAWSEDGSTIERT